MASNIFGRPIQQETNQSYGVNRSNRARTTSYYATPDKTRQPQKKNTRFIRRRPQPQPKLSEPAPAIPSLHLDLVVYNQVADIIKGESNRKILYDLILADKSKTDKFLVDELVNELKTHKNSPITPSEAKRQLYALEKRILNRGGSPESSPDDAPPQSPVPKILTRSCPPQPLADPTLTEICESIYREDIDEIKKQKSTLTQMLGIGLIILLSSQEKSQHIQDVRTSLILNAIKKLPQKIVNGTISSSRMSRLRYHIEVLPSVACTLGEKKCYDLLKQSILFYENVIGEIPKESTESSQILDPSSQFLDPTSQFLNIPQHSLSPKSSNRSFRSGRSGLTQQSFTSSSMFQDYNDRGEMYQEIPLYLTGTTTVRRQPRLDMYSRTQAFINVRQNEDGSYPSMGLSSMRSAGTSGGLCESPNQKFIRMRQNRQGKTVVLDNTHSKSFRNFKEKVDNSVSQEPVYRILTPDLWDFQGSREDLHSMRGIKQMG